MFINIFTGISIDEIQSLIQHSEAQIQTRKINYVFKIETLNVRYFNRIYSKLKEYKKIVDFISKLLSINHKFYFSHWNGTNILQVIERCEKCSSCLGSLVYDYLSKQERIRF